MGLFLRFSCTPSWPSEGRLGVDVPVLPLERCDHRLELCLGGLPVNAGSLERFDRGKRVDHGINVERRLERWSR